MSTPLKKQAEEIIETVSTDIAKVDSKDSVSLSEVDSRIDGIANMLMGVVHDVDLEAAGRQVTALKESYPDASPEELVSILIKNKCQQTGTVGAVTSGAGLVPGIGTAAAVVLGTAADIGATFKLQAELVLEIAHAHEYNLTEDEKKRVVLLITGLSVGASGLARKAGQQASIKISEKLAEKSILKALPVIGIIASAGTNVLSTYIIGHRADAYFRLGPEGLQSWGDSLRAITGVDEQQIGHWLAESGKAAGNSIVNNTKKAGQMGKSATLSIFDAIKKVGGFIVTGISNFFKGIFFVVTFIPRKIAAFFTKKKPE